MATQTDLKPWILDALTALGGQAHWVDVAKHIWGAHEDELRASGDLFYTWQYKLGWAAKQLVDEGRLEKPGRGVWILRT
ncbi:hypothetical protein SAMN05445756_0433 [Kytococcus aerolatus]|uniref:Restriction system protein Mrr-like N-terminal domain-containing protein n=1 Tax=Kytococcus aerolatus TaxID=592308 RepID=A0A212T5Q7_9MICO|nr:hypothetical protein [Kytococcus aerolatus]SNC61200.1 hypothetical protein SAMN05445756_0433 [Kytococcus aerolatus]